MNIFDPFTNVDNDEKKAKKMFTSSFHVDKNVLQTCIRLVEM